ncbi:MAG: hypothetical protein H7126_13500 [Candidatus Parcubacteria bacterium]|nr:hypothetical protein [Leptolyngbyaceae cyanobacterium LF-bin-113]
MLAALLTIEQSSLTGMEAIEILSDQRLMFHRYRFPLKHVALKGLRCFENEGTQEANNDCRHAQTFKERSIPFYSLRMALFFVAYRFRAGGLLTRRRSKILNEQIERLEKLWSQSPQH